MATPRETIEARWGPLDKVETIEFNLFADLEYPFAPWAGFQLIGQETTFYGRGRYKVIRCRWISPQQVKLTCQIIEYPDPQPPRQDWVSGDEAGAARLARDYDYRSEDPYHHHR